MLWILSMLSCGGPSDEELYRQALEAAGEPGLEACTSIRGATTRADCLLGVAERAALQDQTDLAWRACDAETVEGFHDECVFLVVDRLPLQGAEGWERCEGAGQYRDNCIGHILTHHLEHLDGLDEEVGHEEALRTQLAREGRKLELPLKGKHYKRSVTTALTRHVARRWSAEPFDKADCGSLDRELCRRSYAETMTSKQDEIDQSGVCASDLSASSVDRAGGTPWVEGSGELARESWEKLCSSWGMSSPGSASQPG